MKQTMCDICGDAIPEYNNAVYEEADGNKWFICNVHDTRKDVCPACAAVINGVIVSLMEDSHGT